MTALFDDIMCVGLIGKARCGKTTVAEHWRDRYGFEIVSFADALKETVLGALVQNPPPRHISDLAGTDVAITEAGWRDAIYTHRTPFTRWLLQFVGTDVVRDRIDSLHWVTVGAKKIQTFLSQGKKVVVPDLRFLNEAAVVRGFGGDIVRIIRTDGKGVIESGAAHASEMEMDEIIEDHVVRAPTGVEGLLLAADRLIDAESRH